MHRFVKGICLCGITREDYYYEQDMYEVVRPCVMKGLDTHPMRG